jgi:signal transduction histidine kinase
VAIQELLDVALQVATHRVSRLELTVVHEIEDDLQDLTVDRARIRQVFENLIINALEVMGERGRLTLRAQRTQDNILLIEIEDSGPGVASDVKEKLFYPFFTTKANGSGIGLSVARKIVEAHQGALDVENVPGGGARFTVRLPMDTTAQGSTT